MQADISEFRGYQNSDRQTVMALLDANIPEAFAPNERPVFEEFLDRVVGSYQIAFVGPKAVAAYLLSSSEPGLGRIGWFMAHPEYQGRGIGRNMILAVQREAQSQALHTVDIAASHVSEGFYAKFGAVVTKRTNDGWGPGMHRIDMVWKP